MNVETKYFVKKYAKGTDRYKYMYVVQQDENVQEVYLYTSLYRHLWQHGYMDV